MDVTKAIAPKSDQLNNDDLITGPRTIKIRDVDVKNTAEQPIWVYFEGDDNKPWKPCKSSARCLAAIWGPDSSKWIGLSATLYSDPDVTWGGAKVGGIRVSHMEGLDAPRTLMLTKTRGKKGATVIKPLVVDKVKQQDKPAAQPEPETPTIDKDALFSDARENAALGKDGMRKWYVTKSKPEQSLLKEILEELQATAAEADAN